MALSSRDIHVGWIVGVVLGLLVYTFIAVGKDAGSSPLALRETEKPPHFSVSRKANPRHPEQLHVNSREMP